MVAIPPAMRLEIAPFSLRSLTEITLGEGCGIKYPCSISNQGIRVPKAQIASTQPEWWIDHGTVQLLNPEIEISNTDAIVRVTEKHGAHFKTPGIYALRKDNGYWLIVKRE
ncbi:MAG TPA: hypothetical protein ACFCUC_17420 [Desulfobacterales bacterium]